MATESLIAQHVAKLRLESKVIGGVERRGYCVPDTNHPFFLTAPDSWDVIHLPTDRVLLRAVPGQVAAYKRAMELHTGGRAAGLQMFEALPAQLAGISPEDLRAKHREAREYIEVLQRLLEDAGALG